MDDERFCSYFFVQQPDKIRCDYINFNIDNLMADFSSTCMLQLILINFGNGSDYYFVLHE